MLHYLFNIGDNQVLDLDQHGNYRVFHYQADLATRTGNTDPLSPELCSGQWSSIKSYGTTFEYRLIYLESDRLLVWENDGNYRIYVIDRNARDGQDPLPSSPEVWGKWNDLNYTLCN